MTAPRQVVPGASYLVTRRCAQRQFLLRPAKLTNDVFAYVLAVAAQRFGVLVHAYCVLSNHYHLVVTDPDARLPAFQQFLDALVARAVNAAHGRWETFWAPSSYSAVLLASPEDIIGRTAYLLANPVAAGLVRSARLWPGLWSPPERFGGDSIEVQRPSHFFNPKGTLPEKVSMHLTVPGGFASPEEYRRRVTAALAEREAKAVADRGGIFLGGARVLAQKPTGRPSTREPRRNLNPRVAARNLWHRVEALGRRTAFLRDYRAAWARKRAGEPNVVFPFGTYLLRVMHGVPCAAAG